MNYSDLATVKQAITSGSNQAISTQADAIITRLIGAASEDIEEYVTQKKQPDCKDYFKLETITDELIRGISNRSNFLCWPHKPHITSVSAIAYRINPTQPFVIVDPNMVELDGDNVIVWSFFPDESFQVKISYTGGFGTDIASLPSSLVECATVLTARYFKEAATNFNDAIGLAETGVLLYTKSMPQRVKEKLDRMRRVVPW